MGNFYTNYTLKGPGQDEIVEALTDRNAVISPERDGCVVVYDQESDDQDLEVISRLASRLSGKPEYVRF